MKIALNIVGVLLVLFGAIWVLQGFNMFPGQSFMNGQRQWSVNGGLAIAGGIVLLLLAGRRRR
jgi:hypothetical protein